MVLKLPNPHGVAKSSEWLCSWDGHRKSLRKWNLCGILNQQQPQTGGGCSRERVIALWSKYQRQDDPEVTQGDKIYRLEAAIIDERKLSLAIANSGFMYQDIAPSNYWKIHGTAGPTGDFSSDYLGMLFLIISSVCRHVDGVFSKKKKKYL